MTAKEKHTEDSASGEESLNTGMLLRQLREDQGRTIEEVVKATRISASNIRAIEAQEYDLLPADTFTRGFILLYSEYLGTDGAPLAARFFEERSRNKGPRRQRKGLADQSLTPKKMAEPAHISSASVATLLLTAIVVSFTAFCLYHSWNPFAFLIEPTQDIQTAMVNAFQGSDDQPIAPTGDQKPTTYLLSARFNKSTQVEVTLDDLEPTENTYHAGEVASWTALKHLSVSFDQSAAAELSLNGSPLPFPELHQGKALVELPQQPE